MIKFVPGPLLNDRSTQNLSKIFKFDAPFIEISISNSFFTNNKITKGSKGRGGENRMSSLTWKAAAFWFENNYYLLSKNDKAFQRNLSNFEHRYLEQNLSNVNTIRHL